MNNERPFLPPWLGSKVDTFLMNAIKDIYLYRVLKANMVLTVLLASILIFASPTLARISLLALCIFFTGRAVLDFLISDDLSKKGSLHDISSDFQAIALGPAVLLLVTGLLRAAGLYTFHSAIAVMLGIILISLLLNKRFSRYLELPKKPLNAYTFAYLTTGLFLVLYFYPYSHPLLNPSSMYTTAGFDLFMDKNPSVIPAFGEMIRVPMIYMTHTLESFFALFSYGDHFEYYTLGQFWVHVLLSPLIPLGAYLFFRRFLPWHLSALSALFFCSSILGVKIWSLRGESLTWILGFPFLFTLWDLLQDIGRDGISKRTLGTCIFLSLVYLCLATAHGVVAAIVTFLSFGFVVYLMISRIDLKLYKRLISTGVLFAVSFGVFSFVYVCSFTYLQGPQREKVFSPGQERPPAGEKDAAVLYEAEWLKATGSSAESAEAPTVLAAPPFLDPIKVANAAAFISAASVFYHGNLMSLPVLGYPANLLRSLNRVSFFERLAYCALLFFCCYLIIKPHKFVPVERQSIFWASIAAYLAIIAFSIYMDFRSVTVFPLRATVRTLRYGRFFYWFAVAVALSTIDFRPIFDGLRSRYLSGRKTFTWFSSLYSQFSITASKLVLRQNAEFVIFSLLFLLWLQSNCIAINNSLIKTRHWRPEARRDSIVSAINEAFPATTGILRADRHGSGKESLFDAVRFIRNNTSPGEWVFVNCLGESHFWYLSSGRRSLMDGASLMHIYPLMKRYSPRLELLRKFALTADLRYMSQFSFRYVLLFKFCTDPDRVLYSVDSSVVPTNLGAFASSPNFEPAYENHDFAVFRLLDHAGIETETGPAVAEEDMKPDCLERK